MTADDVLRTAADEGVRFIRLQFTDILGVFKNVVISRRDLELALTEGITFDGSSIDSFVRVEESDMVLRADPATWCVFPWSEPGARTARLICDVCGPDGRPFPGCPRQILKQVLADARQMGYTLEVGPEAEFFLFHLDDQGRPTTRTHDRGTYFDLSPVDQGETARRAMVLTLEEMGFVFEASHHENSPGQHEIRFARGEALETADKLATFRHVVRRVASRHGLHATFMPKPIYGINGSGLHLHLSLTRGGENLFAGAGRPLSTLGLQFLAGLLTHARGMTAVTNPLVNSYKRLVPGYEAPVDIAWSEQNRRPLVRVPAAAGGGARMELRSPDPACNPYLALAVILKAGVDGVQRKLAAPPPEQTVGTLPRNLLEAVAALEQDAVVRAALGEHVAARYGQAKRVEWEVCHEQVHEWELDEYLARY